MTVPAFDGKMIYAVCDSSAAGARRRAVVLSHGLTGHPGEYIHMMARDHFVRAGYDVIRFSYYAAPDDARKLQDCTLAVHARDLNSVLDFFRDRYDRLFVAGHSYGGLTILFADPVADAVSFWDSSYIPRFWEEEAQYLAALDCYAIGWGTAHLIGKAMIEEARAVTPARARTLAQALKAPAQVILAGESRENPVRTALYDDLNAPKDFYDVPGADHVFAAGRSVFSLLERTQAWFDRF